MCVIIVKPEGKTLTRDLFRRHWAIHADGGGYALIDAQGTLKVRKSLDRKALWQAWRSDQVKNRNPLMVLHLRMATHGNVTVENCHPFVVNDGTVMFHNGILNCALPTLTDTRSDSAVFAEDTLSQLPQGWLDNPRLFDMVESATDGDRVAFLSNDSDHELYLMNPKKWVTHKGLLLSNDWVIWKPAPKVERAFSFAEYYKDSPYLPRQSNEYKFHSLTAPRYGFDLEPEIEDAVVVVDTHLFDGDATWCYQCGEGWDNDVHNVDISQLALAAGPYNEWGDD